VNALVVRFLYRHEELERLVEGEPDVLIETEDPLRSPEGRADHAPRARVGGAQAGLRVARRGGPRRPRAGRDGLVHRQEPGPEALRHAELTRRLDQIVSELAALRLGLARPS